MVLIVVLFLLLAVALSLTARPRRAPTTPVGAETVQPEPAFTVEMTAYTSEAAQTDATPALTASGTQAGPGTAAASRDLLERLPYGSSVQVVTVTGEGCGGWVPDTPLRVVDTMSARIRNHLDIWVESTERALAWGRCQAEVRVVSTPGEKQ